MDTISEYDVLCGRGGATNSHPGNKRFRTIVARYTHEYLQAQKKEKSQIARKVVSRIQEDGGRFLKRSNDDGTWVEVTDKKAMEKTLQALREGLDVRHRTFRPEKMPRLDEDSRHDSDRTRTKLVRGTVLGSSSRDSNENNESGFVLSCNSLASDCNDVPELKSDSLRDDASASQEEVDALRVYFEPPRISKPDCKDITAV